MDRRYVQFTLADPTFYDIVPPAVKLDDFAEGTEPSPRWLSTSGTVWRELRPAGYRLRPQGWKLHVSATPDNAARVLVAVANYCFTHVIPFKHLRSMRLLVQLNSKAGRRSGSGRILTVYPASDEQLQRILDDLSVTLAGEPGPYILSDLRIGNGPLYVRYGAFHLRMAEIDRQQVPVIERPDGMLVHDERRPSLRIPD